MLLLDFAVKSHTVRSKFSEVIDEVIHIRPKVVNRHRDHFLMLNLKHVAAMIEGVELTASVRQDSNGEFIASSNEIEDIITTGETVEQAVYSLTDELIEYAYEYLGDSFQMYFNSPNRRGHFRYVMKLMLFESPEEVYRFLSAEPERT